MSYLHIMRYSQAGHVKRSISITVLDMWITVSIIHQVFDDIDMSIPMSEECKYS